ncbi:hypothetical protein AYI70_g487 [Smittium culicis]|uniref:Uncharacterized protein n=1 Tax=Smittium culicis TaxID=133412 RepID=A0A1R1YGT4_9FUNG|nr:hypothetical protein AYI70_g487 [Smittium culicis]
MIEVFRYENLAEDQIFACDGIYSGAASIRKVFFWKLSKLELLGIGPKNGDPHQGNVPQSSFNQIMASLKQSQQIPYLWTDGIEISAKIHRQGTVVFLSPFFLEN